MKTSLRCEGVAPASSFGFGFAAAFSAQRGVRVLVLTGRDRVLTWADELDRLAEASGQCGAALGLRYVLEEEFAARKIPHLVCLFVAGEACGAGQAERLVGAVVLFEYRIGGFRSGLAATGDSFGVRTVFGAVDLRAEIAVAGCRALLDRGARMVLVSFRWQVELPSVTPSAAGGKGYRWSLAAREVQDSMIVGASLEDTLAALGKRTRTGLRAVRRRFDATVPSEFVPDAIGLVPFDHDEYLAQLNRGSLDPIGQAAFNLQLRATAGLKGGFVCGLRSAERGWLALLGGWRQGDTTWVEWQVNRTGFERLSLGSVLRSYLLEEEVRRGTRRLGFHGSTSHSMAHSFLREQVVDVVGRRRSLWASLLVRLVPFVFGRVKAMERRGNFLADALKVHGLKWTRRDGAEQAEEPR